MFNGCCLTSKHCNDSEKQAERRHFDQHNAHVAGAAHTSGKFNVTEAALKVGYNSLSHFSRAFCETMGCCPCFYPLGLPRATGIKPRESSHTGIKPVDDSLPAGAIYRQ